jgi:dihydrofolate synthase/folylpolyglutamate synthase
LSTAGPAKRDAEGASIDAVRPDPAAARAYHDAVRALGDRGRYGIRLGLARTRALLHALGDPHHRLRGALIAGTNGKGSVLALADAALRSAGVRVGATPKPHLVTYRERLQIDGRPIDPVTFTRLTREVLDAADRVDRRHGPPTEFELLTAMILRWFAGEAVEVALVEVGLGGRLDATHAWDGGVAVVTNVALDHTDRLGTTIPAIAREKAAIIERGDLAVTGATGEALAVVRRRARRVGAPLAEVRPAPLLAVDRDGIVVELARLGRTRVGLRGRHQAENVAVAHALLDALAEAGIADVPDSARRDGFARATWPGRLELLQVGGRDVLLDGAHNPAGAATLARALGDLAPHLAPGPLTIVHGSMADHDAERVIAELAQGDVLRGGRIISTQVASARAVPAVELAKAWRRHRPELTVLAEPDVAAALDEAVAHTPERAPGPVVVAGSLYLVGEARRRWLDDPQLRDPEVPPA